MVTITLIGLDQYATSEYSKKHTANIANILECDENEIVFVSPDVFLIHKGAVQNAWETIVRIVLPLKFRPVEGVLAKYISNTLNEFSIHMTIQFNYFADTNEHSYVNKDYDRFVTDRDDVSKEIDDSELGKNEDEEEDESEENESLNDIFLGNVYD